jgi:hypothetical protein
MASFELLKSSLTRLGADLGYMTKLPITIWASHIKKTLFLMLRYYIFMYMDLCQPFIHTRKYSESTLYIYTSSYM